MTAAVPAVRAPEWMAPAVPLPIASHDDYMIVADALKSVKEFEKRVEAAIGPHIERAHATWKGLTDQRREALDVAKKWEAECKRGLAEWDTEQERLRLAEQRRLEAEARAQEETRRLAEAAALEAEGIAEADEAKIAEAEDLIAAPIETPVVMVEKATPKVAGIQYRVRFTAQLVDIVALCRHVVAHPDQQNLVTLNQSRANQLAGALRENMQVPGLKLVVHKDVAAR